MNKLTKCVLTAITTFSFATSVYASSMPAINGKPYEEATLREIASQTYPLVATFEITASENEQYFEAINVADSTDTIYIEKADYKIGDVIVVLFKNDNSEIAGVSKLADSTELDKTWHKGAVTNEK
ncbi:MULTISPECIES: hypothetical protein [Bacillus]|uniref:hypothetical protein n=1 Tax=Bacillus TaxID=1386 RepID=UPI0011A59E4A|nr:MULTISPECIES: hypothetical protein [Bacillus]MDX9635993.1 hypothetical protein [Bacillus sp. PBL-C9]